MYTMNRLVEGSGWKRIDQYVLELPTLRGISYWHISLFVFVAIFAEKTLPGYITSHHSNCVKTVLLLNHGVW